MHFPKSLISYQDKAKQLLQEGAVRDLIFSASTYQIHVASKKKEGHWVFLQLDEQGEVRDAFCDCSKGENCEHIAVSIQLIYGEHRQPMHRRFAPSVWNEICALFAKALGPSERKLHKTPSGGYEYITHSGKKVFSIEPKSEDITSFLKNIISDRQPETEKNSIKFSNLSQEELQMWHQGSPSLKLEYELSFWSDLAKRIFWLAERGDRYECTMKQEEGTNELPNWLEFNFPDLKVGFYLSMANLPRLLPALAQIKTPIPIYHAGEESLTSIVYDQVEGVMRIEGNLPEKDLVEEKKLDPTRSIAMKGWIYYPGEGFFPAGGSGLLPGTELVGEEISHALEHHGKIFKDFLKGAVVYEEPVRISYALSFDPQWNLKIDSYVINPGDLNKKTTRFYDKWVYIADDGFYRLEGMRFPEIETLVQENEVQTFITRNRSWLNTVPGFETHLLNVEANLKYFVSKEGKILFDMELGEKQEENIHDFGNWLYKEGIGFFQKIQSVIGLPVRAGTVIEHDEVSSFIAMHQEELRYVPKFFNPFCPIEKSSLHISLNEQETIFIRPDHQFREEIDREGVIIYQNHVYMPGEGFSLLPFDPRIPDDLRVPVRVDHDSLEWFLIYELEGLRPYASYIDPKLVAASGVRLECDKFKELGDPGNYKAQLFLRTDKGDVNLVEVLDALRDKKRFVFTNVGYFDLQHEKYQWLTDLLHRKIDKRGGTVELTTLDVLRVNAFESVRTGQGDLRELISLMEFSTPSSPDITGMKVTLRPYQEIGLQWLWFLYCHGLSGLLCDDMGLGKTLQAMALIAAVRNREADRKTHFLVVCPTSVIFHWEDKLKQFFPQLRVCTFYGIDRSLHDFQEEHDIFLTSYGVWRNDIEALNKVPFALAIFDEVQVAKNHRSRLHKALLHVDAKCRVGLTGTPIENHLRELKALFDLVLPTYMPAEEGYRQLFIKPIEKEQNLEKRHLLHRFIKPFVLRRRKEDVLEDLPEKNEEVAHCALTPEQENIYQEVLSGGREAIIHELEDESQPIPYMHVFAILSKLKQVCNHPAVYYKDAKNYEKYSSGKWELFCELLQEARESGQKVVIFTQYLMQIDILEKYLEDQKIGYAGIRGSTVKRGEEVGRFQNDPQCEVFIASLQAAGLGIELTAASVVIHYDRWWNAARENQATDRVHRSGQTKGVQVFKLVTKGTFEDRIDELISSKGQLMEDIVGVDDSQVLKVLNRKDLISLLKDIK